MDTKFLNKITYGLFLLSARENGFDNGCIINTVVQVANNPDRIAVSVIKKNKTHDMIVNTGIFNVSAITTSANFDLFSRFGMQSGRNVNKFEGFSDVSRSENDILYLTKATNMFLSANVVNSIDLGTHTLFIAELTQGKILSDEPACTYDYYQSDIKPKPAATEKKTWTCTVCGYVYQGDEVPDDFLCPLCNHGKEDFVPTDSIIK